MREPKRFWSKVNVGEVDECWEWQAHKDRQGYGTFGIHYRQWRAHRVAWTLTYGPIPEGLFVCHHCDNPLCCNPYHLFLGTQVDNMRDSMRKGRHSGNVLSEEEVREVRRLLSKGYSSREIAATYGVSPHSIGDIKRGKSWYWLE